MKNISNLPRDLAEEVLCRIPLTSLRRVRSTCKEFNTLSKDKSFAKKYVGRQERVAAKEKEFMVVVMMNFTVYLLRVKLHNNNVESCIKRQGKLIGPDDSDQLYNISHCDGLFLCITKDDTRLMVWHPYWGHTRWIEATYKFAREMYYYALGYDKSTRSHKILRYIHLVSYYQYDEFKIYDFNSDSWRVLDVPTDWVIYFYNHGASLKGNTYWFATAKYCSKTSEKDENFLVCFDFTRETFGPPLSLPFVCFSDDVVCLSSVRQERLAVLFQPLDTLRMEIWVTTKIAPNAVSWNSKVFLEANIKQLIHPQWQFPPEAGFFIDEETKVAVVFDKDRDIDNPTRNIGYIIGVDGSFKDADLGESADGLCPIFCSYVSKLSAT